MTTIFSNAFDDVPGILDSQARLERRQHQDEGRRAGDHGDDGRPSLEWTWTHLTAIVGAFVFTFTLGANWHRLDALMDTFNTHVKQNADDHATFANQKAIDQHFDSLQRQIEDLKTYLVRDRARGR